MLIKDISNQIEELAPIQLKESFDNVGLLVGSYEAKVEKVLLSLDINNEVVDEAIKENVDLIITHHPLIFGAIKNINDTTDLGKKLIKLIKNDIAVYSAHTNLDSCEFGTNDVLFDLLELEEKSVLIPNVDFPNCGLGRVGTVKNTVTLKEFVEHTKSKLALEKIVYCDDNEGLNKVINKVGLCTGSSGNFEFISKAKALGCDVYITGDLGFHSAQLAEQLGIALIDGTHYATEVIVLESLKEYLEKNNELEVIISKVDGQTIKTL